jgi:hypothetical protein
MQSSVALSIILYLSRIDYGIHKGVAAKYFSVMHTPAKPFFGLRPKNHPASGPTEIDPD